MKLTILVDLDGITADLLTAWLEDYNNDYGPHGKIFKSFEVKTSQVNQWALHKCIDPEVGIKVYDYLNGDLFSRLQPLPGAVETINRLRNKHEVLFVTSPSKDPTTISAKMNWIKEYFPNFSRQDVFLCHKKYLVKGDILIDDSPTNLLEFKEHNPHNPAVTISYPYNECVKDKIDFSAPYWGDTERAWLLLEDFIENYAVTC